MSSPWYNGQLPSFGDWTTELYIAQLQTERDIWKKRAEGLRDEIDNISRSIEKYGYWQCPLNDGSYIKLVKASTPSPTELGS